MSRREFEFREGGSQKFWAVEVSGKTQTVTFGRIGTAGQTKAKDFPDEAAATAATEKLIAEKVGKGYVEVTKGQTASVPAAPKAKASAKAKSAPPPPLAPPTAEPPAEPLRVTREIGLTPEKWPQAFWRLGEPKAPPNRPPRPFDQKALLEKLKNVRADRNDWVDWRGLQLPAALSPQEAQFWFEAIARHQHERCQPATLARKLAKETFDGKPSPEHLRQRFRERTPHQGYIEELLNLLPAMMGPLAVARLLLEVDAEDEPCWADHEGPQVAEWMASRLLPALPKEDLWIVRGLVGGQLTPQRRVGWQTSNRFPLPLALAAVLGMHEELQAEIAALPDGLFAPDRYFYWGGWNRGETPRLILSLANGEEAARHFQRLGLQLTGEHQLAGWLMRTGFSRLEFARDHIQAETNKNQAEGLARAFCAATAPEMAPHVLELKLNSKAQGVARQWLDDHPVNAIAGLIPLAAGTGKLADAARDYLRSAHRKGHGGFIEDQLKGHPPEVQGKVRKEVFERAEDSLPALDDKGTPEWLKKALKGVTGNAPSSVGPADLPPLRCGPARLNEDQVRSVLAALQKSTLDKPHPLAGELKKHLDRAHLDTFAWGLCQRWLDDGAPTANKWALIAVGLLGGDGCVLKLTPLVRAWPGESQHPKAVLGLECLRAVGSDTALIQLNGIAQKVKFQGLKKKAQEFMEAIASERGMSRAELEDRIVPDLDLDERGSRVFDFGPRRFRVVLSPDLTPQVRDEEGKARGDLPKPGAKDDAEKANAAVAEWKLLKKQLREVLKIQAPRLEQAMVTGRRWGVTDFETLLVRHPVMTHLAQRLLWGGYDKAGKLKTTFRVTEDRTFADVEDNACSLEGVQAVGIVHPLHLGEKEKSAWGQVFGDYDLIAPFPQLGRPVYALDKDEAKGKVIDRLAGVRVPGLSVRGTLEKQGWVRGSASDHGVVQEFVKHFPGAAVSAVLAIEPGIPMGLPDWTETQKVTRVFFLGGDYDPLAYPWHREEKFVPLAEVDPVAVSEVLGDLQLLRSKAE